MNKTSCFAEAHKYSQLRRIAIQMYLRLYGEARPTSPYPYSLNTDVYNRFRLGHALSDQDKAILYLDYRIVIADGNQVFYI